MSYPRALTRAVLCMLLSLMLLACEEGGKGAPGSSGPREVVIIKLEPRREVYTTPLPGASRRFRWRKSGRRSAASFSSVCLPKAPT